MVGNESRRRVNTIRFQYPRGSAIPKEAEFAALLKKEQVDAEHVLAIYSEVARRSILVKLTSKDLVDEFLQKVGFSVMFQYSNKVSVELKVSEADEEVTMVRCFELQPEIDDSELTTVFEEYGSVKKITWEKTSPTHGYEVYNGVRRVFIKRDMEIPNLLEIGGRQRRVVYDGQTEMCFRCKKEGHKRFECPDSVNNRLNRGENRRGNDGNHENLSELSSDINKNLSTTGNMAHETTAVTGP